MSEPVASETLDLAIVGAGFSGLAMAIRAEGAGFSRFLILEGADGVGGTWRANAYPGAGSDVPSHLYALSFAPRPAWSRLYPRQPEIEAYLQDLVARHGLDDRLRLSTRVTGARWDEAAGLWRIETDRGGQAGSLAARVLVCATGLLHRPARPALPGLDRFRGALLHTAAWDPACPLEGRRVGVIGTGASAVQLVPEIAGRARHLTLFQRSAPWVLPRGDRAHTGVERALFARLPGLRRLYRSALYWQHEIPALLGFTRVSGLTRVGEALGLRHLHRAVPAGPLREALTPHHRFGCKRVLISDAYYPALTRPDVAVVTAPIRRIVPAGVETADGAAHPLDLLVLATGFDVAASVGGLDLVGRGSLRLSQAWGAGMDAYQGLSVHGFPNCFRLLGPNTALGHNSVLLMVEAQVAHVLDALRFLRRRPGAVLDVRREAQARFRARVDAGLADSIWSRGGCTAWYRDEWDRNRTLWPGTVAAYRRSAARMRLADYETAPSPAAAPLTSAGNSLSPG